MAGEREVIVGRSFGRAVLVALGLAGALPAWAGPAQGQQGPAGRRIRITAGGQVIVPGVITVDSLGTVNAQTTYREDESHRFFVVESGGRLLHVPKPASRVVGRLIAADETTITIACEEAPGRISIPRSAIAILEEAHGTDSHVFAGFVGGLAVGSVFAVVPCAGSSYSGKSCGDAFQQSAGVGTALGALLGLALRTDHWEPAKKGQIALGAGRTSGGGVGLALVLRY